MNEAAEPKSDRRAIFSWCLYDFANSAFTTLAVTFIYAAFFTKGIADNEAEGTVLWSRGIAVTAVAVALLSPFVGALADRGGYRKLFLLITTIATIIGSVVLYFIKPGQTMLALSVFVVANISFEMANVFYNAFLPDIAPSAKIGRISGYGWSFGYVGGLLAMVIALYVLVKPDPPLFGLDASSGEPIRATNLLVAFWFALFAIPMFLWVKEDKSAVSPKGESLFRESFQQFAATFREIRKYRQIVRFLVARLIFNDGLVTIFALGGIYAQAVFGFTTEKLLYFGILLNVTAAIGAFGLGFLDDILGGKRTIHISLIFLTLAALGGMLAPNELVFWISGSMVGIFAGPNQAASRSLMGRFVPPEKENEFFGFFAFSGKATAFLGPFLFSVLTEYYSGQDVSFEPQRAGISVVVVFFIVGGLILTSVNEKEGVELAARK